MFSEKDPVEAPLVETPVLTPTDQLDLPMGMILVTLSTLIMGFMLSYFYMLR